MRLLRPALEKPRDGAPGGRRQEPLGLRCAMLTDAMVLRAHGGPEVLRREAIELPEPGPREVRVRVHAVALNHIDLWGRRGIPHIKVEFPHRLGADIAGTLDALGPGARLTGDLKVGDRVVVNPGLSCGVCARCLSGRDNLCKSYGILGENRPGGYARHINLPDANILPYPGDLPFPEAAAIPLCFLTAWQMVVTKAQVSAGQSVLVQAAGSGVGTAAVQIAKMLGARVIATAGSDEKCKRALELGADHAINYRAVDFVRETKNLTDRRGVDVVIEHVGGDVFTKSVLATAWGGKVVTCGATAGFSPELDLRQVFFRQVDILGSTMGSKADLFRIVDLVRAKRLQPVVDRVMPLWNAREAHQVLEDRAAFGKVVLEVD